MSLNDQNKLTVDPGGAGETDGEVDDTTEFDSTGTFDDLVTEADVEAFDRTYRIDSSDVDASVGNFVPIPFPWEGIPRAAITFTLSHTWDPEEEQWERDTGNGDAGPLQEEDAAQPTVSIDTRTVTPNSGTQPSVDVTVS